jgi:hypothetical protein
VSNWGLKRPFSRMRKAPLFGQVRNSHYADLKTGYSLVEFFKCISTGNCGPFGPRWSRAGTSPILMRHQPDWQSDFAFAPGCTPRPRTSTPNLPCESSDAAPCGSTQSSSATRSSLRCASSSSGCRISLMPRGPLRHCRPLLFVFCATCGVTAYSGTPARRRERLKPL